MFSATPTVYFALHFACWAPERLTTLSRMIYRGGSEDEVPTLSQQSGICRDDTLCFRWGGKTHSHTYTHTCDALGLYSLQQLRHRSGTSDAVLGRNASEVKSPESPSPFLCIKNVERPSINTAPELFI